MQIYALDDKKALIIAHVAQKQSDYLCPECGGKVRVRKGKHRTPHFFHLSHNKHCLQSGKSAVHLAVQNHLLDVLPAGEVVLECRFGKINRIADVVWMPRRLVFEVQCSSITAEEVQARNRDYAREGFQVAWILHDQRFNRWRVTAAEECLQQDPVLFTNMDARGRGKIYAQRSVMREGVRVQWDERRDVNLDNLVWEKWLDVKEVKRQRRWLDWYWMLFRVMLERASR